MNTQLQTRNEGIETLRISFLNALVTFGYYDKEDLVVVEPSRDHPTFRFERDRGEPALERTSLEISLRNNIAFLDWFM
jgi:hypothetical protein